MVRFGPPWATGTASLELAVDTTSLWNRTGAMLHKDIPWFLVIWWWWKVLTKPSLQNILIGSRSIGYDSHNIFIFFSEHSCPECGGRGPPGKRPLPSGWKFSLQDNGDHPEECVLICNDSSVYREKWKSNPCQQKALTAWDHFSSVQKILSKLSEQCKI